MHSHSVEYKEADLVTIPALSSKAFGEYCVAPGEFARCGFIRNPQEKENSVAKFDETNSPFIFENRLTFVVNGKEVPVISRFYVSEFENLPESKVLKDVPIENCAGFKKYSYSQSAKVNLFAQSNRYFVKYEVNSSDETGRR